MTTERWRQIEPIFQAAMDLDPAKRSVFLAEVCAGDQDLRRELDLLLAADESGAGAIETAVDIAIQRQAEHLAADQSEATAGRRIGAYRVTGVIGRGGMGVVCRAVRDDDQFQKQVAIKIVKRGMDTEMILTRFRRERQILARLEHPNIARLLDGGMTETGLPYLVMEYVEGSPLMKYCTEASLPVSKRLEMFRSICAAVQYAHQNLVVHRDLKPANILVTQDGTPKLLDFGVAKLLDQETAEHTVTALRMLTPDYASPEQVRGEPVTTFTDIYSLGAILYELVAGRRAHQFPDRSAREIERTICDADPAPIPGELGHITQMAMRKEPERRYSTADQLSEDVRRHLSGLPVVARKDTAFYRLRKFVGRYRLAMAASSLALVAMVATTAVAVVQMRRAERRFNDLRRFANALIQDSGRPLSDAGSLAGREKLLRLALDSLDSLARGSGGDPSLQMDLAAAYRSIARIRSGPVAGMGDSPAALVSYRKASQIYRQLYSRNPNNQEVALLLSRTDMVLAQLTTDPAEAMQDLTEELRIIQPWSGQPRFAELRRGAYFAIAEAQRSTGDPGAALRTIGESGWTSSDRDPIGLAIYAAATAATGDLAAAMETGRRILAGLPAGGKKPYQLLFSGIVHAEIAELSGNPLVLNLGDRAGAREHYGRAVEILREYQRAVPPDADRSWLAKALLGSGTMIRDSDPGRAVSYFREALPALKGPDAAVCRTELANALRRLGKTDEALQELQRALEIQPSVFVYDELGDTGLAAGDRAAAAEAYRKALATAQKEVAAKPHNMPWRRELADAYEKLGDFQGGNKEWIAAHDSYKKSLEVWTTWTQWGVSSVYDQARARLAAAAVKKSGGFLPAIPPE